MKKKIMLIAGCSHAAGSEIDGKTDSPYNRSMSFGGVLAKFLEYRPCSIALNGSTNSSIARSIITWFNRRYKPEEMELFVLACWTDSTRVEIPWHIASSYENGSFPDWFDPTCRHFLRVNMGYEGLGKDEQDATSYFQKFIARNNDLIEILSANQILQTQYFLKSLNVPYLMTNSMPVFTSNVEPVKIYKEMIDKSKYYNWNNNDECFFWKYRNAGYINPKAKYWHHDETPHRLYAVDLLKFIGENKCL